MKWRDIARIREPWYNHCRVISASDTGIMASSLASEMVLRMLLLLSRYVAGPEYRLVNDLCSTHLYLIIGLECSKEIVWQITLVTSLSFPLSFLHSSPILKHWSRSSSNSPADLSPRTGALPTNQDAHLWATWGQYAVERRCENTFKVRPQCVRSFERLGDELEFPMSLTKVLQRIGPQTHITKAKKLTYKMMKTY